MRFNKQKRSRRSRSNRAANSIASETYRSKNAVPLRPVSNQNRSSRRQRIVQQKRDMQLKYLKRLGIWALVGLVAFLLLSSLRINTVTISDKNNLLSDSQKNQITEIINDKIDKTFLKLKPFIDVDAISLAIIESMPSFDSIDINMALIGSSLNVSPQFKAPFMEYSGSVVNIGDYESWLTKSGQLIFVSKPQLANLKTSVDYRFVDNSDVSYENGDFVVPEDYLKTASSLIEQVESVGLRVEKIIASDNVREIELGLLDKEYNLRFSTDRPVEGSVEDLVQAITFIESNNIKPKQYLDIRVVDKIFYK